MFCYKCGKQLDEGTNFCPHCGATQKKDESNQQKEDTKRVKSSQKQLKANKKVIAIVCVVVVILGAVLGIISSNNAKKENEEAMINALIGTTWCAYWQHPGANVELTFVDKDTFLINLGPGNGTDEYKWEVTRVEGNKIVIKDTPSEKNIYGEYNAISEWISPGIDWSVSFSEDDGSYVPYALNHSGGTMNPQ